MSLPTPILADASVLRAKIHEKVSAALVASFPIDLRGRTLDVSDVKVHAKDYSTDEQKHALLTGGSLQETVKGTLTLRDLSGKVLDTTKNFTLVHLPYFTERHTLIAEGNEYQVANMLRRRPGVYTQRGENGELHTTFNLSKGKNFDVTLNPAKGSVYLQYGTANIPAYAALRALGVPHEDVVAHWGAGVANANRALHGTQAQGEGAIAKLYEKLEHPALFDPKASHEARLRAVQKRLDLTSLDPEITALTLGHGHAKVTPLALLQASKKLLAVHEGKAETDDADSLAFKSFHSVDDFLAERIKLTARTWAPKLKFAFVGKHTIREAMKPAPFTDAVRKFVTVSQLTAVPPGINVLEFLDHAVKVTSLGEGGIPSERAIPLEARMTHSTHFGILDPVRTPESSHSGVDVRATLFAHRDDAGNLYTPFHDVKTGKQVLLKGGDLMRNVVAFPHQALKGQVDAFVHGKVEKVDASRVTHQALHLAQVYSPATSLIPMIHNIQGNRAIMGSKMGTQALPLLAREVPLVQVQSHVPGRSFETLYGHMMVPRSTVDGTVEKIEDGWIYVRPHAKGEKAAAANDGLVRIPYQTNFPFPSKTFLHHDLTVKPGQEVHAGQAMGESNFTRQGTLALGKNLKVAYMAYHGMNSNDAVVISEGCAQKLTSEHMYRETFQLNAQVELSKAKHKMYFGTKYTPGQYAGIGERGVVKKGAVVNPHDLLVCGLAPNPLQGTDVLLGRISKALTKPYRELTLAWTHGTPGTVIDVVESSGQICILVKTQEKMQVGDKLCYDEQTEVLTEAGWKRVADVTVHDEVATLVDGEHARFCTPTATHVYATGDAMVHVQTAEVDLFVTANHKMWCKRGAGPWGFEDAVMVLSSRRSRLYLHDHGSYEVPPSAYAFVEGYAGPVYGLTVPSGVVYVRRNGKAVWSGNSGRYGNKGVVSKIVPDHEMIRDESGAPIDVLLTSAGVISRCYDDQTEFLTPQGWRKGADVGPDDLLMAFEPSSHTTHWAPQRDAMFVQDYVGTLYCYESNTASLAVTPGHTMYGRPATSKNKQWRATTIEQMYSHNWEVPSLAPFVERPTKPSAFQLPTRHNDSPKSRANHTGPLSLPAEPWARFLGWYLSEGYTVYDAEHSEYKTYISQSWTANPAKVEVIGKLLQQLPFTFHYKKSVHGFVICNKRLTAYLRQFGKAKDKFAPPWLFAQPEHIRTAFLDALWAGDGYEREFADGRAMKNIQLTATRLIDDVQHLLYLNGVNSVVTAIPSVSAQHNPMWRCGVHLRSAPERTLEKRHWSLRDYTGRVYCPSVPSGFVVTRRHGKILIAGNTNPAQIIETCVAKVAEKTNTPILYDNTDGKDAVAWAKNLLKLHGVKDKETVYDPVHQRHIHGPDGKGVLVGRQYIYKLFKSTDTNYSGHGVGPYDLNEMPLKTGGDASAKGLGKMEFDALVAHNARNILNEAATIKGQKNDEFWRALQLGLPMPAAKPSFAFNKFTAMLEGAGIQVDKRGSKLRLLPLTDKAILARSAGPILNKKTVIAKSLKPETDGLFDPARTGGPQGTLYSHIDLHEPVVNPVFEDPVRRLMGWSQRDLDSHIRDKGGVWIQDQLRGINVPKRLVDLRAQLKTARGIALNDVVKQIKYLEALQHEGLKPHEAYTLTKIPVIPPCFRPITPQHNDPSELMIADANKLYGHLLDTNHVLKTTALPSDLGKHRAQVYSAVGAVFGTNEVENDKLKAQGVTGFLSQIAGVGSPKGGFFQRKLMRRTQDVSGRGTIVPDVSLDMDEVGMPETMLWQMYDKMLVARLVRQGYPALHARELVDQKAPVARAALLIETKERPVLINRAPTLHRWSILAAFPKLVQGKTIRMSPFMEKGLSADYDGNCFVGSTEVYLTLDPEAAKLLSAPGGAPMKFGPKTEVVYATADTQLIKTTLDNIPYLPETKTLDKSGAATYQLPQGLKVWSYDHDQHTPIMAEVTAITIEESCPVARVKTQKGFEVTASTNESLCIYNHVTQKIEASTPMNARGHLTPVMNRLPSSGQDHDFNYGWMIGAFVSDGFLQGSEGFGYAKVSDLHRDRFARAVDAYEGCNVKRNTFRDVHDGEDAIHGPSVKDRFYHAPKTSALFAQCYLDVRVEGRACLSKKLPDLSTFSPDALLGVLAGLIDGDGTLSVTHAKAKPQVLVYISTSAHALVKDLHLLGRLLGIRVNVSTGEPGPNRLQTVTSYTVVLSIIDVQKHIARLITDTSYASPRAHEAIELLRGPLLDRRDIVPVPFHIMALCAQRKGPCAPDQSLIGVMASTRSRLKVAPYLSRPTALRVLQLLRDAETPDVAAWGALIEARDAHWDLVEEVQDVGHDVVYDLVVPSTKIFVVNGGLVVWDTLQVHAPITPGGVEDAKTMTLSSMLLGDRSRNTLLAFPQHEAIMGVTLAAKAGLTTGHVRHFKTKEEALAAYRKGELKLSDMIEVDHVKTAGEEEAEPLPLADVLSFVSLDDLLDD